jgi:hypothetical protein
VLTAENGELLLYLPKGGSIGGSLKLPKSAAPLVARTVDLTTGAVYPATGDSKPGGKASVIWLKLP